MGCLHIEEVYGKDILIVEEVEFDILQKDKYIDLFINNKEKGMIAKDTKFEDNLWIYIRAGVEEMIKFPDDIQVRTLSKLFGTNDDEFNLALKSYTLFNIRNYAAVIRVMQVLKRIAKDNWKIRKVEYDNILSFIEYIKIPEDNETLFKDKFGEISEHSYEINENTTLPSFEDIFVFNDIINDIIENKGLLYYKDYILILMWWKICSILPLRPNEFLRTKYHCIYEEDNKFYLKVQRNKAKAKEYISNVSDIDEYFREDVIRIDSSTFDLIQSYRELLNTEFGYDKNLELFPYEVIKERLSSREVVKIINKELITHRNLRETLNSFYDKVISKDYGFKPIFKHIKKDPNVKNYIEKLNPYAARHIAIINLVLIGCDILDVMHLAGHEKANTAFSYFNHVKEFSKGRALGYMRSILNKEKFKENNAQPEESEYDAELERKERKELFNHVMNIVNESKKNIYKVDGGYCYYSAIETDRTFCYLYEGDHTKCNYFKPDNQEVIKKVLKNVETELDANIRVLEELIMDMKKIPKFNELYKTVSFNLSQNIKDFSNLNLKLLQQNGGE